MIKVSHIASLPLHITFLKWKITRKRYGGGGGGGGGFGRTSWKIFFFSKSFVKSRPIEARRSERLALQIVSLEPPKMSSHFGMLSIARGKQTLKIHSTYRLSHQYNQEGQAKPAEECLHESMTEKEEKNEIIEANYAWNIHLTIYSKMAFLNRDWSKLLP